MSNKRLSLNRYCYNNLNSSNVNPLLLDNSLGSNRYKVDKGFNMQPEELGTEMYIFEKFIFPFTILCFMASYSCKVIRREVNAKELYQLLCSIAFRTVLL